MNLLGLRRKPGFAIPQRPNLENWPEPAPWADALPGAGN